MSDILKKPYEISLWNDEQHYIVETNNSGTLTYSDVVAPVILAQGQRIVNDYIKEVKVGVLGSDQFDHDIRAFSPKLTMSLNGSHKLVFSIYAKYWNDQLE